MQAIILCGGSATRLGAAAKHTPKLLMKVKGRSILQWQCEFLKEAGVQELILATGHLHDVLQNTIGGSYNGISIRYCRENKKLDTGGAIKKRNAVHTEFSVLCAERGCPMAKLLAQRNGVYVSRGHDGLAAICLGG